VTIDGKGIDERTRRVDVEGTLGGRLFEVTIRSLPRPAAVAAFVAKNAWAAKVDTRAPFGEASAASFLTGLTSPISWVVDVSILGLGNVLDEKKAPKVLPTLEALANEGAKAAVARAAGHLGMVLDLDEKSLATIERLVGASGAEGAEGEDDEDDDESDEDEDSELTLGTVTLPSGKLAIVDQQRAERGVRLGQRVLNPQGAAADDVVMAQRMLGDGELLIVDICGGVQRLDDPPAAFPMHRAVLVGDRKIADPELAARRATDPHRLAF
jgi:hypothetical protein